MKIYNFEQHTAEWDNIRKGKITASVFKSFITPKTLAPINSIIGKKALSKIIASTFCINNSEDFQSYDMAKGTECEPRARQLYQQRNAIEVEEIGFIEDETGFAGFSPDGLVGEDGMIEIKTQCQKVHFYCKIFGFDEWLKEYKTQILLSMLVNPKIKWCDCISYNEDFDDDNKMFVHRYKRNDEELEKARIVLDYWINELKSFKK